jgi:uncharacterized protein (DUF4415 family)
MVRSSEWVDPDDAPEIDDAFIARAEITDGRRIVRRGRPPLAAVKQPVSLRLDADVIAHFKAGGAGWHTRINEALRHAMARAPSVRRGATKPRRAS